jgi:hypothetical protein
MLSEIGFVKEASMKRLVVVVLSLGVFGGAGPAMGYDEPAGCPPELAAAKALIVRAGTPAQTPLAGARDMPAAQAARINFPDVAAPRTNYPDVQAPRANFPDVAAPRTNFPDVAAPRTNYPDVQAPRIEYPDVAAPRQNMPDVQAPRLERAGSLILEAEQACANGNMAVSAQKASEALRLLK